jgi:hypothetical protein
MQAEAGTWADGAAALLWIEDEEANINLMSPHTATRGTMPASMGTLCFSRMV